jgi:hypothetical protein
MEIQSGWQKWGEDTSPPQIDNIGWYGLETDNSTIKVTLETIDPNPSSTDEHRNFLCYNPHFELIHRGNEYFGTENFGFDYNATSDRYEKIINFSTYADIFYTISNVDLMDNWGNSVVYKSPSDFELSPIYLNNTERDYLPPVLHAISTNSTSIMVGDTVEISLNATDDISGIQKIRVNLRDDQSGADLDYSRLDQDIMFSYDSGVGLWRGQYQFVSKYWGHRVELFMYMTDQAGNTILYRSMSAPFYFFLTVEDAQMDSDPPVCEPPEFLQRQADLEQNITILFSCHDDKSGMLPSGSIWGYLTNENNQEFTLHTQAKGEDETSISVPVRSLVFSSLATKFAIREVTSRDNLNNYLEFQYGRDFPLTTVDIRYPAEWGIVLPSSSSGLVDQKTSTDDAVFEIVAPGYYLLIPTILAVARFRSYVMDKDKK